MSPQQIQPPDPDVVQAISDFRFVGRRVRNHSERLIRATSASERANLQRQIDDDMAALETRAARIGDGMTGGALLLLINDDDHARARRVARPLRESVRVHLDRVQEAIADETSLKLQLEQLKRRITEATIARQNAEIAARAYVARGAS